MKVNVTPKTKMKQIKLIVHQPNFSEEDLIINPKDFPTVCIGDVMEIYHPDNDFSRLLLQVTSLKEFQQKDAVSVKQSIANTFQLRTYADVIVNVVNKKDVTLDSVELTFKDQYLGRSDMWRLKKNLENTCAYLNKKIEFCGIRCEVFEMWSQGDRVACGVINDDTKIVFRSSTSQVYLFIQMSSEMWDTDINGDLYFEKAVNGFLADLFVKWKKNSSSHEVTIVLFSRTYYEAQSIEEFPEFMRECLQQDYKGRFHEDFYRVAVQNERYDDWTVILVELKQLFNKYPSSVLEYHKSKGEYIPKAVNSTAAQGNFLEVLNMSLNVFEKHYLDRSFDRTGQLSVVITPGVGVFEVDRELTNITKQRIIDNGVGSDLVCLGEQPLHAVPLFKFHNKNILSAVDDYSMPHWINLSFYSSSKQATYSSFVPRIKLPPVKAKLPKDVGKGNGLISRPKQVKYEDTSFPSLVDYDAYDAQVFKLPSAHISGPHNTHSLQRAPNRKKSDQTAHHQPKQMPPYRKFSEADISLFQSDLATLPLSAAVNIPSLGSDHSSSSSSSTSAFTTEVMKISQPPIGDEWEEELSPPPRAIVGSAGSSFSPQGYTGPFLRPGRALINPFDPSHVTIKLTSNRRRWTHVFPLGPTGIFMQQHHYQAIPHSTTSSTNEGESKSLLISSSHEITTTTSEMRRRRSLVNQRPTEAELEKEREAGVSTSSSAIEIPTRSRANPGRSSMHAPEVSGDRSLILLWGATGEQEWTPALTTGVDWKSLTIPACLPLTTDYFPDSRSLQNDYVVSDYTLLPDDVNVEITQQMELTQKLLSTEEVFDELVSQRLQQGFQQIVFPRQLMTSNVVHISSSPANSSLVRTRTRTETDPSEEYVLSIGRIFHKVSLMGSTITVTCFRPRHPYPTMNIQYLYRFQAPRMETYQVSSVNFKSERLENYNWNYLDHYICWRGQGDFGLIESLKYWRFRMVLLPIQPSIRKLLEETDWCDCYQSPNYEEMTQMVDGFSKFLEVVNRLKKPFSNRKTRKSGTFPKPLIVRSQSQMNSNSVYTSQSQFITNSIQQGSNFPPFRERGGSNRFPERPRPRSGSKIIERVRSESGNGGRISPAGEIFDTKQISTSSLSLDTGTESLTGQAIEITDDRTAVNHTELQKLSFSSSLTEILDALKHSNDGIGFFSQQRRLPPLAFVSAEAAFWITEHVDGANSLSMAINILERMLDDGLICHASGNRSHPMVFGFILYYVVDKKQENDSKQIIDLAQFRKDWVEVAIDQESLQNPSLSSSGGPFISIEQPPTLFYSNRKESTPIYKEGNLEMEPSEKVNRAEWGHTHYHETFYPNIAFEISVQWMVATSSIITEVVQNWARKANLYGFHLVPIPSDPFAFPFSYKSDPLRGPIYVALNCDVLLNDLENVYFQEAGNLETAEQIFRFQEAITQRFGFVPCLSDGGPTQTQYQFIHLTGSMFLMIVSPSKKPEPCNVLGIPHPIKSPMSVASSISSPHENYITRHVMGKQTKQAFEENNDKQQKVGFYWSWNYMLTKRWKTSGIAVDDPIANKIFRDFQDFCNNKHNRLKEFWNEWQQLSYCAQL